MSSRPTLSQHYLHGPAGLLQRAPNKLANAVCTVDHFAHFTHSTHLAHVPSPASRIPPHFFPPAIVTTYTHHSRMTPGFALPTLLEGGRHPCAATNHCTELALVSTRPGSLYVGAEKHSRIKMFLAAGRSHNYSDYGSRICATSLVDPSTTDDDRLIERRSGRFGCSDRKPWRSYLPA